MGVLDKDPGVIRRQIELEELNMKRANHFSGIIRTVSAMLALVLVVGVMAVPAAAAGTDSWKSNLLTTDPLGVFGFKKELIGSVTFLDSLESAPRNAWNLGKGASARVKGWVTWQDGLANIYIAAKGGVNGEKCTEALFEDCTALEEISFGGAFHTETAESMKNMFHNCENLLYVDTENLDTSSVTTMYQMFRNCYALEELDLGSFDTSNVTNMYCMFSTCYSLKELDLSKFNTSKVTNMAFMFSACRALEKVNVSRFDTAKVTNMEGMFRWCDLLEEPDLGSWNVSRVENYSGFMNEGMTINGRPWREFFR